VTLAVVPVQLADETEDFAARSADVLSTADVRGGGIGNRTAVVHVQTELVGVVEYARAVVTHKVRCIVLRRLVAHEIFLADKQVAAEAAFVGEPESAIGCHV